jgi:enoyl-CoA hydratase
VDVVEREDSGGIAVLHLNRPDRRNALSGALIEAILAAFDAIDADRSVRVAILTGRGKSFCAGGDLADGLGGPDGFLAAHRGRGRFAEVLGRIPKVRVPVIAALNGDALGGGLGLAAACDLVVADPAANLGTPEIKLGLFPMIILAVLKRQVPQKALMELVLTGGKVDAARARDLGLVNRVSAPGAVLDEARALAAEIAARSPAIVELGKAAFHQVSDMGQEDALAYLHTQLTLNLLTEDAAEGVSAFLSRREPQWKGR